MRATSVYAVATAVSAMAEMISRCCMDGDEKGGCGTSTRLQARCVCGSGWFEEVQLKVVLVLEVFTGEGTDGNLVAALNGQLIFVMIREKIGYAPLSKYGMEIVSEDSV